MSKIAIVTGGSRGLGAAMVLKLGEMGYNVVINYRQDSSAVLCENLIKKLTDDYHVEAIAVQADMGMYEECEKLVDAAVKRFGDKIDVLVNNAGIQNNGDIVNIERKAYERLFAVNMLGVYHMCHLTVPYMLNHSSNETPCNIVNIASVGGLMGVVNQSDYCAAKSGVIGLTRGLGLELAGKGIRVNAIAPGLILTDMLSEVNQEELAALSATIPQGFVGSPSDIAGAMEYLLKANYCIGQVISPNGGLVLGR